MTLLDTLKAHKATHEGAIDPFYVDVNLREWHGVYLDGKAVVISKQQDQDVLSYTFRCELCDAAQWDMGKAWTHEATDDEWNELEWT